MEKTLTIKTIESTDSKKDGTKLVGKFGPYWLVKADTEEEGKITWFSKGPHTHKPGDKITGNLEVTTSEKDGKSYTNKNFSFPKKTDGVNPEEFRRLTNRVTTLEMAFERKFEELKAKIKSDAVLDMTGKVQTTADSMIYSAPHPMIDEGVPLDAYKDEDGPF